MNRSTMLVMREYTRYLHTKTTESATMNKENYRSFVVLLQTRSSHVTLK